MVILLRGPEIVMAARNGRPVRGTATQRTPSSCLNGSLTLTVR